MPDPEAAADSNPEAFSIADLVSHDLYAGNSLLGEALFFRLNLPKHWELAAGVSRPEVSATHERKHKTWVVHGDAWYVIYDQERGWAMELAARVRGQGRRASHRQAEVLAVSGHAARAHWKTNRRGLPWKRHDVTYMTITFDCPYTERRVELEFSGWCPPRGFEEMREAARYLICH